MDADALAGAAPSIIDWRETVSDCASFLERQETLAWHRGFGFLPDMLIAARHTPAITLGAGSISEQLRHIRLLDARRIDPADEQKSFANAADVLRSRFGVELVRARRGGRLWYHDPGVLQLYLIAACPDGFPAAVVYFLEETLYRAIRSLGAPVERVRTSSSHIGVWSGGRKLGAIGVRVSPKNGKNISQFGVALNVAPDERGVQLIDPCGIAGCEATALADIIRGVPPAVLWDEAFRSFCTELRDGWHQFRGS